MPTLSKTCSMSLTAKAVVSVAFCG
jgi:hypothetical protein